MAQEDVKHSIEKARIAQQKARDPTTGRFLDPGQQQMVAQQHQAIATEQQRQKLDSLFGRSSTSMPNPIPGNLPSPQPQNNFQAILAANKPGGGAMNAQQSEEDKWDTLLGKKKSNIQW